MIVYRFVKIWARITTFFYFRKIAVTHKEKIPKGASVIFAPNHQSAFLDPIVIAVNTDRDPWFLTRASVFKGDLVKSLLKIMHMVPVYRPRDMVDLKTANNSTFKFCQEVLLDGRSILIFPEGNHGMQKRLRTPLKKGIGRIALRAAEALKDHPERDVMIVPVGINYEHPTRMRTDLLLNFGSPISVKSFIEGQEKPEAAALKELREELAHQLSELMIDIRPKEHYDYLEYAWQTQRTVSPSLTRRFLNDKELVDTLAASKPLGADTPKPRKRILRTLLLLAGFPFWLLGVVLNLGWIITVKLVLKKLVKDPHFIASVNFICVMVGVPLFALLTASLLNTVFGGFWIWLAVIPLSGLLAYEYQSRILKRPKPILTKDLAGDFLPED
ncbi:lysophospholipid acyltransferase family protein [Robertkochia flava]|uniref:lysophospholipid acyltransferase family protein n=1 Tax=Robertkochia flava TaxID=3447986 RepID=UPI001CCE1581|nr:lysophospholipid acyltransferase family protein [Robertkochia marina]